MTILSSRWGVAGLLAVAVAASPSRAQDSSGPVWSPDQLDQILGPIALYPDPLLALILPAATDPTDLVLADQSLAAGAGPAQIAAQPWDGSILGLAHYPVVLEWMAQNIEWTTELGQAYVDQPRDVEESIQRLRARAQAAGALVDSAQQRIVVVDGDIEILPAETDVIYIPTYNPEWVYGSAVPAANGPFITFSAAFAAGPWLSYRWDWSRHGIWIGASRQAAEGSAAGSRRWRPPSTRPQRVSPGAPQAAGRPAAVGPAGARPAGDTGRQPARPARPAHPATPRPYVARSRPSGSPDRQPSREEPSRQPAGSSDRSRPN
jgi:hypothetical protein